MKPTNAANLTPITEMGTARMEITPPKHVPLAGFAHRKPPNEGVSRPLYVRAWVFIQAEGEGKQEGVQRDAQNGEQKELRKGGKLRKVLFVQADLIWWGPERLDDLRYRLRDRWSIEPERMLFHATHTHGGPQTSEQFSDAIGTMDAAYMDFLEQQVELAIEAAHENVEPVRMEKGTGECSGISINRRKAVNGSIEMAPNPEGVNDKELTVICFVADDQRIKGIWFHFTCHPTTTGDNLVTSDYSGAAMEKLDETFGAGVSCFLQGCCGDIRPALIQDNEFFRGNDSDVLKNGVVLAESVLAILNKPMIPLTPAALEAWSGSVDLAFQRVPSVDELQPEAGDDIIISSWKRLMLSGNGKLQPSARLSLQLLRLAEGLSFLAINGEVVVEYGLLIRQLSYGQTLPLAYSNGMVGYIPTARQIDEGGYESDRSGPLFGYPSPFTHEVEINITDGIRKLLERGKTDSSGE